MSDDDEVREVWDMSAEQLLGYMRTNLNKQPRLGWARDVLEVRSAVATERAARATENLAHLTQWLVIATFVAALAAVAASIIAVAV